MEVDVLYVGAGPANLASAIHLLNLAAKAKRFRPSICILEKGRRVGAHSLSGAVMDPIALKELLPDYAGKDAPVEKLVTREEIYYLTAEGKIKFPIIPPRLKNRGNLIISLSRLTRWLARIANELGAEVLEGVSARRLLYQGDRVVGARAEGRGFANGDDIRAKITVLGEGSSGALARSVINRFELSKGKLPQVFELAVKEIFQMPPGNVREGRVIHTLGYPMNGQTAGGSFIYSMARDQLAIGLVVSLDSPDPQIDPHVEFQRFKSHPFIRSLLSGGNSIYYGAKTIPGGGYYTVPRLVVDGALIVGDSASLVNMERLKGIHLAMKSGMCAAEVIVDALEADDFSAGKLAPYQERLEQSYVWRELRHARNFRQAWTKSGFARWFHLGMQQITNGRGIVDPIPILPDAATTKRTKEFYAADPETAPKIQFDEAYLLSKPAAIARTATQHDKKKPTHISNRRGDICRTCWLTHHSPCNHFCPAGVFKTYVNPLTKMADLSINFVSCIHCKACDVKCPKDNIIWVPPEGGSGPDYEVM